MKASAASEVDLPPATDLTALEDLKVDGVQPNNCNQIS